MSQNQESLIKEKKRLFPHDVFEDNNDIKAPDVTNVANQISDFENRVYSHAKFVAENLKNKVIEETSSKYSPKKENVARTQNIIYELKASSPKEKDFPLPDIETKETERNFENVESKEQNLTDKTEEDKTSKKIDKEKQLEPQLDNKISEKKTILDYLIRTENKLEENYDRLKSLVDKKYQELKGQTSKTLDQTKEFLDKQQKSLKDNFQALKKATKIKFRKKRPIIEDSIILNPPENNQNDLDKDQKIKEIEKFIEKYTIEEKDEDNFLPEKSLEEFKKSVNETKNDRSKEDVDIVFPGNDEKIFKANEDQNSKLFSQKMLDEAFEIFLAENN